MSLSSVLRRFRRWDSAQIERAGIANEEEVMLAFSDD
jgi:hypothetical protein